MLVVPYEEWHFSMLKLEGPEKKMIDNYGKNWTNLVAALKSVGVTYSWYDNNPDLGSLESVELLLSGMELEKRTCFYLQSLKRIRFDV